MTGQPNSSKNAPDRNRRPNGRCEGHEPGRGDGIAGYNQSSAAAWNHVRRSVLVLILAFAQGAINAPAAKAEDESLLKAIQEYRLRRFEDAAADFGAAMPTEFNNPYLHYYMGNCMVHLRHQEAAIREYRIAYALQPDGQVGSYCKLCLDRFGIDAEGRKTSEPTASPKVAPKRAAAWPLPAPPSAAELADLRANPRDGSSSARERERSVDNLRDLMQQHKRPLGAPLPSKVGTNLYVRNYTDNPGGSEADKAKTEPPTSSGAGNQASQGSYGYGSDYGRTTGPGVGTGTGTGTGSGSSGGAGHGSGHGPSTGHGHGYNYNRGPGSPGDKWSLWWW